jgi:hypothetical protein
MMPSDDPGLLLPKLPDFSNLESTTSIIMTVQSKPVQQLTPFGHALAGMPPVLLMSSSHSLIVVQVLLAVCFPMRELHFSGNGQRVNTSTE